MEVFYKEELLLWHCYSDRRYAKWQGKLGEKVRACIHEINVCEQWHQTRAHRGTESGNDQKLWEKMSGTLREGKLIWILGPSQMPWIAWWNIPDIRDGQSGLLFITLNSLSFWHMDRLQWPASPVVGCGQERNTPLTGGMQAELPLLGLAHETAWVVLCPFLMPGCGHPWIPHDKDGIASISLDAWMTTWNSLLLFYSCIYVNWTICE